MSSNGKSSENGGGGMFEDVEVVHTTDEEGNVHIFEKVQELEVDGKEYALLIYRGTDEAPIESSEEDEEVVVMRLLHEDGLEVYENIDDEDEFDKVVEAIEGIEEDEEGELENAKEMKLLDDDP